MASPLLEEVKEAVNASVKPTQVCSNADQYLREVTVKGAAPRSTRGSTSTTQRTPVTTTSSRTQCDCCPADETQDTPSTPRTARPSPGRSSGPGSRYTVTRDSHPAASTTEYRPQSPNLTSLPKSDHIICGRVEKTRRETRLSYNGPKASFSTPWRLGASPHSRGETFDYTQWFSKAKATGVAHPAPKIDSNLIGADKITADRSNPPSALQTRSEAAIQGSINGEKTYSGRQGHVNHHAPIRPPNMPTRFMYSDTYRALSIDELQNEAELRHLDTEEQDDTQYLIEVLMIDDKAFTKRYHALERERLDSAQLRDEAIMKQVPLDTARYYNPLELLAEIAGKSGRDAVDAYNQQLKQKKAADLRAANQRAAKKQRQERARRAQEVEAEKAISNAAQLVAAAAPKSRLTKTQRKEKEPTREASHSTDSGYSTEIHDSNQVKDKSKKRPRSNLDCGADTPPSKKMRLPADKAPRVIKPRCVRASKDVIHRSRCNPVPHTEVKVSKNKQPPGAAIPGRGGKEAGQQKGIACPLQRPNKQRTPRSRVAEEDEESEEESDDDDDDWLVDDTNYRSRRRSKVAQMAASGLVSGMR
ncbi:uncharacterized protein K460DRAFT_179144 [Cucurbitaria berberidis CBS 394.84]|uniref:Uncharacterized protein n=1 Tax=Cucurbitaria berberidis CBS 394.84 TaxID=1168544 RepID=A0A9P4GB04_9PLEO|nr:uncharacterized protein K460DRAFT_179144 [Cucurbitaria berberidis CBS 394.84]KAF1842127.1 hypothetical protein K460DRAFT_179144 [Cucurbitaria berberidis CBS 394.84]